MGIYFNFHLKIRWVLARWRRNMGGDVVHDIGEAGVWWGGGGGGETTVVDQ